MSAINSPRSHVAGLNATQIAMRLGEVLQSVLDKQKSAGVDTLAYLAQAARDAADGAGKDAPQTAALMRISADAADKAGVLLRDQNVDTLLSGVGDFARRQPVAFFGCGVLAGLIIARLFAAQKD